jgi:hypothetical protein
MIIQKISLARALELLKLAGVQVAEISNDGEDEGLDNEAILSQIDQTRAKILAPQWETTAKKDISDALTGRLLGSFRSTLARGFGIKREDLANLDEEGIIKKALELYNAKFGQDSADLRAELQRQGQDFEARETAWKEREKTINADWQRKYNSREITECLMEDLKDAPLGEKVNRLRFVKELQRDLEADYHLHFDEKNRKVELRDKTNNELPVYLNDTKTAFKTPKDVAKEKAIDYGFWETDMRNKRPDAAAKNYLPNGALNHDGEQPKSLGDRILDHLGPEQ